MVASNHGAAPSIFDGIGAIFSGPVSPGDNVANLHSYQTHCLSLHTIIYTACNPPPAIDRVKCSGGLLEISTAPYLCSIQRPSASHGRQSSQEHGEWRRLVIAYGVQSCGPWWCAVCGVWCGWEEGGVVCGELMVLRCVAIAHLFRGATGRTRQRDGA
jgi:hypothetical protein